MGRITLNSKLWRSHEKANFTNIKAKEVMESYEHQHAEGKWQFKKKKKTGYYTEGGTSTWHIIFISLYPL